MDMTTSTIATTGGGEGEDPKTVLRIQDLDVEYSRRSAILNRRSVAVHAVKNVSLDITAGQTLALVGESGSGKSTLCRAIVGLVPTSSGTIRFEDVDLLRIGRSELKRVRKRLQLIFQNPYSSLQPRMKVGDIIAEPLAVHKIGSPAARRAEVLRMLARVGLDLESAERYPPDFSGGQRQRIAIARALITKPSLVICDEAVASLDASVQGQILNLLMKLQADMGVAFLFITHDFDAARAIAHEVAVMRSGEIVETGRAKQVLESPQHEYTKALVAAVPQPKFVTGETWADHEAETPL